MRIIRDSRGSFFFFFPIATPFLSHFSLGALSAPTPSQLIYTLPSLPGWTFLAYSMSKRLLRDIQSIKEDQDWAFVVTPSEADINKLKASFEGPKNTPYEGGVFVVDIVVPNEYPLKPPNVKFDTRLFHPNVSSQTGAICLDILKNAWTPVYTIKSILISLQQLLDSPNPSDPQDAEVAAVYLKDRAQFDVTAAQWTRQYAQPPATGPKIDPATLDRFAMMGFPPEQVAPVMEQLGLETVANDDEVNRVVEALLQ